MRCSLAAWVVSSGSARAILPIWAEMLWLMPTTTRANVSIWLVSAAVRWVARCWRVLSYRREVGKACSFLVDQVLARSIIPEEATLLTSICQVKPFEGIKRCHHLRNHSRLRGMRVSISHGRQPLRRNRIAWRRQYTSSLRSAILPPLATLWQQLHLAHDVVSQVSIRLPAMS